MLKRREKYNIYVTHVCRHHHSGENPLKKINYKIELSASTMAFISCKHRVTKVLAEATRGKREVRVGEAE
jgi:hypothetical protein